MNAMRSLSRVIAGLLLLGGLLATAAQADDAKRFLTALREQKYYDVALEYLDMCRVSGKGDQDFLEAIDYEAGLTLIESSLAGRSMPQREKILGDAETRLESFLSAHPNHGLALSGKRWLAELLAQRAEIKTELADQKNKTDDDKKRLQAEARKLYEEAQKAYTVVEQAALEKLKAMPKVIAENDPEKAKQVQYQQDLLDARNSQATVLYKMALTHPAESKLRKDGLTAAAKSYNALFEKYKSLLSGQYARMYEGCCYREMGEAKKALVIFEDLITSLPDGDPAILVFKNQARVETLKAAEALGPSGYAASVALYKDWAQKARAIEESSKEGLAIKYLGGVAALEQARRLAEADKDRRDFIRTANEAFRYVARFPGDYQAKARTKLGDPLLGGAGAAGEPKTFAEARDRAMEALERMSHAQTNLQLDQSQGKTSELKQREADLAEARDEAIEDFTLALRLRTNDVKIDDVNAARYFLAHLYYNKQMYPEAAVLGEFLARHYPSGERGKNGAQFALASYAMMLGKGGPDKQFESDRLVQIAEYMASRWAGQVEADNAWMTLIATAAQNHDVAAAKQYLAKIPTDAVKRGEAEQVVGQMTWGEYLRASRLPNDQRPPEPALEAMKTEAQTLLEAGIERARRADDEGVAPTLAASSLYLAQIYVETGQAAKAVALLDDPKVGAKTLAEANHPATQKPGFAVEAMRLALRAYVATQDLPKAEQAMASLEKLVHEQDSAEASKRLTQIYIRMGKELEEQLDRLRNEHKDEQVADVTKGFETFLTKILEREKGNNYNSLAWVAATFMSLGDGCSVGGSMKTEADRYYGKANESYEKMLARLKEPDFGAPENAEKSIKIRQARVLRMLKQYGQAMALLQQVLGEKPNMVDGQLEAAYTLQAWAETQPNLYQIAIAGSKKQKMIWGWGVLARKVQTAEGFRNVFHEARYNLALCRFKQSQGETDATRKGKYIEQAIKDIEVIYRLYPEMGGPEWYEKYDSLLKSLQKLAGVEATGLAGLKRAPDAAKTETPKS